MAILLTTNKFGTSNWVAELKKIDKTLDIRVWPDIGNPADIQFAILAYYLHGELQKYPNLKCACSIGAGMDHILNDPYLPSHISVVRIVDSLLARDISQYVIWGVLNYTRLFSQYREQQDKKIWQHHLPNNEINIGIMGLGQLGSEASKKLLLLGFVVSAWSRTPKLIESVQCFHGEKQFHDFLAQTKLLINLLPLTSITQNILNKDTFYHLPKGAYIINAGRGAHLVDLDLIKAIDDGQISGACLDVFRQEPLPHDHPFWSHPKITLTPHIASITNPKSVAPQIVENYHRLLAGKPLLNQVDIQRGY